MRSEFLVALAVFTLTAALPARTAPPLHARFSPRSYVSGGRVVPVSARKDMLAVHSALSAPALAVLVEKAALKAAPEARIASVKLLHRARALTLVEFAVPLSQVELAALAAAIEGSAVRVYPVLSRMSGRAFADDYLVVTASPGRLPEVIARVLAKTGGALVSHSVVPHTAVVRVGAPFAFDAVEASAACAGIEGVVSAEPDLLRELAPRNVVLNDARFADQWHLSRQNDDVPGTGQIFADLAWDTTLGDPSVVVAVFDSGIDVDHPDLTGNMLPGFDSAGSSFGSSPPNDTDARPECSATFDGRDVTSTCPNQTPYRESHGTSVAGVIAAVGDNGIGVAGVCPRCSILPVRLLGDEAASGLSIAAAFITAIDMGAWVINNSWGPGFSLFFPLSQSERDAFVYARTQGRAGLGTVIVFAAGNDTSDVAGDAYAAHPYTIAVAAVTNLDDWAYYSNFGAQIDVAAPSQGLPEEQDGIPEDDFGIVTTDVSGNDGYDSGEVNPGFSGTSASSPVTAGVAGLVLSANPALTAEQVRLILTSTADKIVADKIDWTSVIGEDIEALFAYDEAGHSIGFGYGRVNAAAAVAAAQNPGVLGGDCDAPACTFCSADGVCLTLCAAQSDCPDGSVCGGSGACELPRERASQFLSPCSADCAFCTPTLDSEFFNTNICTIECGGDDDCPNGFDCRLTEVGGPSICGVGDKGAGEPNDLFGCFSPQIGTSIVVVSEGGRELCGDVCFDDGPGACPFGFTCAAADCQCTADSDFGCFELTCSADADAQFDENDFAFPVCLPNAGHADTCESDVDCQRGDYCQRDSDLAVRGACMLDDRDGCDICTTCASDDDCLGRGICIGLRDDGIGECAWGCGDADACPGDSQCRTVDSQRGGFQVCLSPQGGTTAEDRCDPGYACAVACRDDVPCPLGSTCTDGACAPTPPASSPSPSSLVPGGCTTAPAGAEAVLALSALVALAGARRRRPRA